MAVLNDEQVMLRDMAREWADNEAPVAAFRRLRDAATPGGYDPAAWESMAQMGWAGILVPEEHGGSAFGFLSLGLVAEQLGRTLTASPLAATAAATAALVTGYNDEAGAEWLPRIAAGEVVATLAFDEDPLGAPHLTETRVEDGRVTGTKRFVAEGASAGLFVVAAANGLHLVAAGEGVTATPRSLVDARGWAEVAFADAPAVLLSGVEKDWVADRATAITAAEMLGGATAAFEMTNAYLKTRVQFGQPLASFQALQHRMARMFTELELARSTVEDALAAIDAGRGDVPAAVSLAKATVGETLKLVSRETIQLHGGIGMTDEHDAGLYLKRAAVLEAMWGNSAWHRDRWARLNGY